MRVLLDNGAYTLRNMGDVAMLQTAVARTRTAIPGAEFVVLSSKPALLEQYCPKASGFDAASRNAAYTPPPPGMSEWRKFWRKVRGKSIPKEPDPQSYRDLLATVDATLVAGGGFLNDLNRETTFAILRMLEDSLQAGKKVALFGQGLGPMQDPQLLGMLRGIVARGAWIGLREAEQGCAVLGVSADQLWPNGGRIAVTGDDAVEAAWEHGRCMKARGQRLGVSIRHVEYSGVELAHEQKVADAIRELRKTLRAEVVPIPVSFNDFEDDPAAIARVTGSACGVADNPGAVMEAAAQARAVLTGTYHAAVFALAQGIPCVCFFASPYYRAKLEGLAAQFGRGCMVVDLASADSEQAIVSGVTRLWQEADGLREELVEAAGRQVGAAQAFHKAALNWVAESARPRAQQ